LSPLRKVFAQNFISETSVFPLWRGLGGGFFGKFTAISSPQPPPEGEKFFVTKLNFAKNGCIRLFGAGSNLVNPTILAQPELSVKGTDN